MAKQVENAFAAMLVNYDWRHPDLKDYVAQRKAEQASRTDEPGVKLLVLANPYCIPNHFVSFMRLDRDAVIGANASSEERRNKGMLTYEECRAILEEFVAREELIPAGRHD